tara:strand:+ start:74 stop:1138 length:1065 start_codon:yes stop_codon:yes gene_type:complete
MQKISSIEFLRFFSSLMILVWHYQQFYLPYNFFSETEIFFNDKTIQPFFKYIKLLYTHGNYGVDFFFIISGYVFAHVYLIKKKITSGKEFFINRFARLYPLHLLTLLIVLFLQIYSQKFFNTSLVHTNNDLYHFILNFFFISGWGLEKGPSFNGPIWSVSLEIIIYFFFFFLLIKSKNFMLLKSIIIVFLLVLLRKTTNSNFLSNQISFNINIFNCGILFFTGVIVHFLNKKITNRKVFITFGLILLIFSLIGNFKILIFLPSVIIIFLNFENLINKKLRSLFNFLGNLTYGMYLWHLPLQIILMLLIKSNNLNFDLINSKFFFICYLALVFSVSIVSYYYFEKKFRERLRFKY